MGKKRVCNFRCLHCDKHKRSAYLYACKDEVCTICKEQETTAPPGRKLICQACYNKLNKSKRSRTHENHHSPHDEAEFEQDSALTQTDDYPHQTTVQDNIDDVIIETVEVVEDTMESQTILNEDNTPENLTNESEVEHHISKITAHIRKLAKRRGKVILFKNIK